MIEIDGSQGEGGGQILRSSLSLAICTQQPFRIRNIRARREKPGLMRQHLTAVRAAAQICDASVEGDAVGSRELTFRPGPLEPGDYSFAIGTAGSCTLVLQTVLPPLLTAKTASTVRISGGTHNKGAPPFDFLQRAFLPLLRRMGADIELMLDRYGFYPRGGGEIRMTITPGTQLSQLDLKQRGELIRAYAEAYVAALPIEIAQRELAVIGDRLKWSHEQLLMRGLPNDQGPGNAVTITLEHAHVTEVFTGFGERGLRAEAVAETAAMEAREYSASSAPVGEHLADQLLLLMAIGAGGLFITTRVTDHLTSNALVIERFTNRSVQVSQRDEGPIIEVR